jgi:hypothetical protein
MALNTRKPIRKFFKTNELLNIVISNFYLILFYNSEVWHIPSISQELKYSLFVASTKAINVCLYYPMSAISYCDLKKTTHEIVCDCITQHYCGINLSTKKIPGDETMKGNTLKIGLKCATNRFHHLNDKIPSTWFNKLHDSFKVECKKKLFLSF